MGLRGLVVGVLGTLAVTASAQPFRPESLPVTFAQQSRYSCGAAALATVLARRGVAIGSELQVIARLKQLGFTASAARKAGYSLAQLAQAARSWGFRTKAARVSLAELRGLSLPALVRLQTPDGPHFSVLARVDADDAGVVELADPSWGVVRLDLTTFSALWLAPSGRGIVLAVLPPLGGSPVMAQISE